MVVAACAFLASCLVLSSCVSVLEGDVTLRTTGGGRVVHRDPAPPPRPAPAPRKAPPPQTRHERQNVSLSVGQMFSVNESRGDSTECYSSDSSVLNLEGQRDSRGSVSYSFKAYNGGDATITFKRYQDGYLVLEKEIYVHVREPAPPPPSRKGSSGGLRKAYQ
jgi:hypothetical protein